MSIILDALRKAEMERGHERSALAALGPDLAPPRRSTFKVIAAVLIGLALGIIAALLGVYFVSHHSGPKTVPPHKPAVTRKRVPPTAASKTHSAMLPHSVADTQPITAPPQRQRAAPVARSSLTIRSERVRRRLPSAVDWQIQVFSWTPRVADRYVVINMHLYRVGDHLPDGARLLAIQNNGLLIEHHGHHYFVPRP